MVIKMCTLLASTLDFSVMESLPTSLLRRGRLPERSDTTIGTVVNGGDQVTITSSFLCIESLRSSSFSTDL